MHGKGRIWKLCNLLRRCNASCLGGGAQIFLCIFLSWWCRSQYLRVFFLFLYLGGSHAIDQDGAISSRRRTDYASRPGLCLSFSELGLVRNGRHFNFCLRLMTFPNTSSLAACWLECRIWYFSHTLLWCLLSSPIQQVVSVFGLLLISCACVLFRKIDLRFYTHPPYILDFITGPDTASVLFLLTAFFFIWPTFVVFVGVVFDNRRNILACILFHRYDCVYK